MTSQRAFQELESNESTDRSTAEDREISVLSSRPYRRFKVIVISVTLGTIILLVATITTPLVVGTRGIHDSSQEFLEQQTTVATTRLVTSSPTNRTDVFSWSEWSSWEPYNATCGYKMRMRRCKSLLSSNYGTPCSGPSLQKRKLNLCRDCKEWYLSGVTKIDGVYTVSPDNLGPFRVYCDMTTDGGGWTVFQRRQDGSEDFFRKWIDYKTGFGNLNGEFWLGNDKIHRLTANETSLRVDLEDWNGNRKYAKYRRFKVASNRLNYRLNVQGYSGSAGDSLTRAHNGMKFSTKDNDNDPHSVNCAARKQGAWWYNDCHDSNLNGLYLKNSINEKAVTWYGFDCSFLTLKFSEMKLRYNY